MKQATVDLMVIAILVGLVGPVGAEVITVDPDDYAIGSDISEIVAGVTLMKRLGADADHRSVFSLTSSSTAPNRVFGHSEPTLNGWGGTSFEYFEARFDAPAFWVSLDFIRNTIGDSRGYLNAYNESGILIGQEFTDDIDLAAGTAETLTISRPTAEISYIFASWDDAERCYNGELDNLRAEVVPEPSSIVALLSLALTCGVLHRRRKRQTLAGK